MRLRAAAHTRRDGLLAALAWPPRRAATRAAPTSALETGGAHRRLAFADFRHYVEERLQLTPRALEQRAALEARLWASPALQEARRQRVSYEKLRVLARLAEADIKSWIARAKAWTCVALRRALEGDRERQLRARRTLAVPLPRRVAVLLAAAMQTARDRVRGIVAHGTCLAIVAAHFFETWKEHAAGPSTRSQNVRARDDGACQVPGCSHRGAHAHHIEFRSQGGGDEPENQVAVCGFHHLRCIHGGYLKVLGRAPDALTWLLDRVPWAGPTNAGAPGLTVEAC